MLCGRTRWVDSIAPLAQCLAVRGQRRMPITLLVPGRDQRREYLGCPRVKLLDMFVLGKAPIGEPLLHTNQLLSATDLRGGGTTARSDSIDDEETENDSEAHPHAHKRRPLARPPIKHRARALDAEERGDHARDDNEHAKDTKGDGHTRTRCNPHEQ